MSLIDSNKLLPRLWDYISDVDYEKVQKVISELPSAEPEISRINLIHAIENGIMATDANDIYSCGMRNGMRWCKSLLSDEEPKFEDASQYAEPERKTGEWLEVEVFPVAYDIEGVKTWASELQCEQCGFRHTAIEGHMAQYNFCPNCGAKMEAIAKTLRQS